ncbi:MAG: DNA polymerase III subunit gamma/tau [Mycoplasma sp.]
MEKTALYRKYRPKNFDEIIGQEIIVKTLTNAIKINHLNHAYIFAGNKGSGKTSIAKIFAKAINCVSNSNGNPCGNCENCLSIANNNCTDIIELDAASNSGVNEIRSLIDSINYLPNQLKYKIYIIDEAHMLTTNSWNALLKTLEEPPSHVIIIFATTEYHKIPATIISRCQRYDYTKIPFEQLNKLIKTISSTEGISIDDESSSSIALLANGSARDALSILDQLASFCEKNICMENINQMFGLVDIKTKINFINLLVKKNIEQSLSLIKSFYEYGVNFSILLNDLMEIVMDRIIFLQTGQSNLLKLLNKDNVDSVNCNSIDNLLKILKTFNEQTYSLKNSEQPSFVFEYICLLVSNIDEQTISNDSKKKNQQISPQIQVPKQNENKAFPSIKNFDQPKDQKPEIKSEVINEVLNPPIINEEKLFSCVERVISDSKTENKENEQTTNNFEIKSKFPSFENVPQTTTKLNEPTTELNLSEPKRNLVTNEFADLFTESIPNNIKEEVHVVDIDSQELKDIFFSIACNYKKEIKDKFDRILTDIKELTSIYDHVVTPFFKSLQFLISSNNGSVILFQDKKQAEQFNKIARTNQFKHFFKENFGYEQFVIGVHVEMAHELKLEFKNLEKKDFKDVKIKNDNEDRTRTELLSILNDDTETQGD